MHSIKVLIPLIWLSFSLAIQAQHRPNWLKDAVFYQIYPSSFQDSDGNGIGDLKGIEQRLGYIESIGVNSLWLNPIFVSAFGDGGYDVIDFYRVDPRFGTNTELVQFVEEVHRRKMHIVLDLVAGHTSNESEWFKESMKADAHLRYSDYYIWADEKPIDLSENEASKWVEANAPRAKFYIKNYYDIQPALNFGYARPDPDHPWEQSIDAPGPMAVRQELKNIIAFWMNKGVDGFRVDLARTLVKNDPDQKVVIQLWQDLNAWFDEAFPEGVLIAEWFNPKQSIEAHFDVDFLRNTLFNSRRRGSPDVPWDKMYFNRAGKGNLKEWNAYLSDQYQNTKGRGYISLPTGNHDSPRIANGDRARPQDLKVAMTYLLTQPGIPFIYYGDEIGMRYIPDTPPVEGSRDRAGTRTPMQWDDSKNAGFSSANTEDIYIPQDPDLDRPTVAKQEKDTDSQLNYIREIIKLRETSAALGNEGEWALLSTDDKSYPVVYARFNGDEKYVIAVNPSDKKVSATIPSQNSQKVVYVFGTKSKAGYSSGNETDRLKLPAVSATIFKVE